jgi:hypothetical protein
MCLGRVGVSLVLGFAGRWCSFLGLLGVQFVLVVVMSKLLNLDPAIWEAIAATGPGERLGDNICVRGSLGFGP